MSKAFLRCQDDEIHDMIYLIYVANIQGMIPKRVVSDSQEMIIASLQAGRISPLRSTLALMSRNNSSCTLQAPLQERPPQSISSAKVQSRGVTLWGNAMHMSPRNQLTT